MQCMISVSMQKKLFLISHESLILWQFSLLFELEMALLPRNKCYLFCFSKSKQQCVNKQYRKKACFLL